MVEYCKISNPKHKISGFQVSGVIQVPGVRFQGMKVKVLNNEHRNLKPAIFVPPIIVPYGISFGGLSV